MEEEFDTDYQKYIVDGVFYFLIWGIQDSINVHTAIQEGADFHTVCILGPEEHEPTRIFESLAKCYFFKGYLAHHGKNLVMIMGATNKDYNYRYYVNQGDLPLVPWDTWWAHQTVSAQIEKQLTPMGHTKIEKAFTSLNNRGHPWRLRFLDHMAKYDLFDKGFVSFHNDNQPIQIDDNYYKFRWWTPRKLNFEPSWRRAGPHSGDYLRPPPEWEKSLWSIISESNTEVLFVTEKSYLPIWHKRPFITYGAPYHHRYLKELGFKLFDEFVDYSFDSVDDDDMRCDMMMQQVSKISKLNHDTVKKRLQPILDYNFKNLIKLVNRKTVNPEIVNYVLKPVPYLEGHQYLLKVLEHEDTIEFFKINNLEQHLDG